MWDYTDIKPAHRLGKAKMFFSIVLPNPSAIWLCRTWTNSGRIRSRLSQSRHMLFLMMVFIPTHILLIQTLRHRNHILRMPTFHTPFDLTPLLNLHGSIEKSIFTTPKGSQLLSIFKISRIEFAGFQLFPPEFHALFYLWTALNVYIYIKVSSEVILMEWSVFCSFRGVSVGHFNSFRDTCSSFVWRVISGA